MASVPFLKVSLASDVFDVVLFMPRPLKPFLSNKLPTVIPLGDVLIGKPNSLSGDP